MVVPTLDRHSVLIQSLEDLLAQDFRPMEILVVDQSEEPSQDLAQLVSRHADVIRWHRVPFRGLPIARNYGWQQARYNVVLYVDDDIRCGPGLVAEHLQALRLPGVGVVAGGIEEAACVEPVSRSPGVFNAWAADPTRGFDATGEHEVDHAAGGNFSVWRSLIEKLGGIDEMLQVGAALYEETEFCLRVRGAGYRIHFNGRARLTHLAAARGGCRIRDIGDYVFGLAHNRALLIRRHLSWFHVPTALARLALLGGSYALHYRAPYALWACASGCLSGWHKGGRRPACTWRTATTGSHM